MWLGKNSMSAVFGCSMAGNVEPSTDKSYRDLADFRCGGRTENSFRVGDNPPGTHPTDRSHFYHLLALPNYILTKFIPK
jgi:hypothetical protein